MDSQRCPRCKTDLPHSAFSDSQVGRLGSWCRACNAENYRNKRDGALRGRPAGSCSWCDADISHLRPHAKYCSTSCASKMWRQNNPGRHRSLWLRSVYGISQQDFDELLSQQGSVCAICGTAEPDGKGWQVDHDHQDGSIRGILCPHCNQGLGHFRDNTAALHAAINYLLSHAASVADEATEEKTA